MESVPILFANKADCCGCGACQNACPAGAIAMQEDDCGHLYPVIEESKCIRCGKCKTVCGFQKGTSQNSPRAVFAGQRRDHRALQRSASGGIFAALAERILAEGGAVYGAAFTPRWQVTHRQVLCREELAPLLGSKYVQSTTGDCYRLAAQQLKTGKPVLYCGTPCQIAGLYGYLGGDRDNLITADLVCHGVPSGRMLQQYIGLLSDRLGGKVTDFSFRDKAVGWGINGSVTTEKNGRQKKVTLWQSASSYLYYFTQGWLYRDSCYRCPYACAHRPADITLGDYWGIENAHPSYLKKDLSDKKGISLVIANTSKGEALLEQLNTVRLLPSTFQKASAGNGQLCHPSTPGKREELMELYRHTGWEGLQTRFQSSIGWRRHTSRIKSLVPVPIKRWLKRRAHHS